MRDVENRRVKAFTDQIGGGDEAAQADGGGWAIIASCFTAFTVP
jgi:hypothetical protein